MPIGTLMKKIIRQPASNQFASISTPAMIGPATADSPITGPNMPNALPSSSAGKTAFRIGEALRDHHRAEQSLRHPAADQQFRARWPARTAPRRW